MTVSDKVVEMEAGLKAAGSSVLHLCQEARIKRSTWTRWKSSTTTPNMATWERAVTAFDALTSVQQ